MSSRNSSVSRPAACAISSAKLCAANAWKLFVTARNQPMRTCASAPAFSARMFGDVVRQCRRGPCRARSRAARARRTSTRSAGTPIAAATPSACRGRRPPPCDRRPPSCGRSRNGCRLRASRSPSPACRASSTASPLRPRSPASTFVPKPPPSSVTWQMTSFLSMPTAAATVSCTACGFCVGVQTSTLPFLNSATAAGGSIDACAAIGV